MGAGTGPAKITEILDTELGLFVLESVAPAEAPGAVWTLLGGYPVAAAAGAAVGSREQQMITVARLLLPRYRSPRDWERLIAAYALAPEQVRGYLIAGDGSGFARREPRVAPHRFEVYRDALAEIPAYRKISRGLDVKLLGSGGEVCRWDQRLPRCRGYGLGHPCRMPTSRLATRRRASSWSIPRAEVVVEGAAPGETFRRRSLGHQRVDQAGRLWMNRAVTVFFLPEARVSGRWRRSLRALAIRTS